MKDALIFLSKFTFLNITWIFAHQYIHELGHLFSVFLTGATFYGFGFDPVVGSLYILAQSQNQIQRLIIVVSGSLFTILLSFLLYRLKKNIFTLTFFLISFTFESIYWFIGYDLHLFLEITNMNLLFYYSIYLFIVIFVFRHFLSEFNNKLFDEATKI